MERQNYVDAHTSLVVMRELARGTSDGHDHARAENLAHARA